MSDTLLKDLTNEELELELGKLEDKRIKGRTGTSLTINDLYPKFVEVRDGEYDTIVTEEQLFATEGGLYPPNYTFNDLIYEAAELRYSPDNPYLIVEVDNEKKLFYFERDSLVTNITVGNATKTGIFWNNQALIFRDDNEEYAQFGPFLLMNDENVTFGSTEFDFTD